MLSASFSSFSCNFCFNSQVCKEVSYFVLYLPCFKALFNENYVYFLSSYDSKFDVNIASSYLTLIDVIMR